MKKFLVVVAALLVLSVAGVAAQQVVAKPTASGEDLFKPGSFSVQAGLGSAFFFGYVDVYGGADLGLGSFLLGETLPFTYGAAARISYWGWSNDVYSSYSYSDIGIAALGTVHFSWKHVFPDVAWLEKLESYVGLGLGAYIYTDTYYTTDNGFRFGFASVEGNNYYLTPNIAINFEGGYYGYGSSGRLGLLFKL